MYNPGYFPVLFLDMGVTMACKSQHWPRRHRLRMLLTTVVVVLASAGCTLVNTGSSAPALPPVNTGANAQSAAPAAATTLSAQQLAGQRVIYAFKGGAPSQSLLDVIAHGEAAGVLFFADNFTSADQFKNVIAQLVNANNASTNPFRHPLLLLTDQEGGQVRRLPGGPDLSEKQIGQAGDQLSAASDAGQAAAQALKAFGLNANLAPVLDVFRQPGNFIDQYGRAYSGFSQLTGQLGAAYVRAIQSAGVLATAKHFPGLGAAATNQDTDSAPVTLNLTTDQIRQVDEPPYQNVIAAGVKLVMASWAVYPALDPNYPAGLSSTIIQGELRSRLGYQGVTITDAIGAGALKAFGSVGNHAVLAAKAGMDLILATQPGQGSQARRALAAAYTSGALDTTAFRAAVDRIQALRANP